MEDLEQAYQKIYAREARATKTCRFCGRTFKSRGARKGHETKAHSREITREIMQRPADRFWR